MRNKKTAPSTVTPDAIAKVVMERDDLQRRLMKAVIPVAAASLLLTGCSDDIGARRALADAGYSDIETTGYQFFGCGQGDAFHTGFRAKSAGGRRVSGVVCSGWLKGNTIRTD